MEKQLYTLPNLPYSYDALEPYIDATTMQIHHDKHHAAYVKNLNDAIEKHPGLFIKSAQDLITNLNDVPEDIRSVVKNNAGGHVNHFMFWQIMCPVRNSEGSQRKISNGVGPKGRGEPSGILAEEINKCFGSFSDFQNKFNEAGLKRFGSGWVWLVQDKDGKLEIMTTPNQDNPMSEGKKPIMGNDVWEHAYYLKYKNMRADYLKAWWNVVNWQEVEKRFIN